MKGILITILTGIMLNSIHGQVKIPLYSNGPQLKIGGRDSIQDAPHLLYYSSGTKTGKAAVIICPGGAYTMLAKDHEGKDVAAFFNQQGFDAFVLMYRLNDHDQKGSRYPAQYDDVSTAMQIVKSRADEFGIDPNKTGILGFSAGGHLASMGATMIKEGNPNAKNSWEKISSRPAFAILVYPVISLIDSFAHTYSAQMLLGRNASAALKDSLSTYKRVSKQTPPTFIVFSTDDTGVPPENGIVLYNALKKEGIKTELHIFDHGGHGYGMAPKDPVLAKWPMMAISWLKNLGIE
jgi:acetyl esterase/lipase